MKKKRIIEWASCIIAFVVAVFFAIRWEPQTLIKMKQSTVTLQTIQQNPGKDFVGHQPGDDIPVLQTAEDLPVSESFYMTVKPVDIIPTNVYTLQPWADPYEKVRSGRRSYTNGKPKDRVVQTDMLLSNEYNRFYLLELQDGSHIFAQLPSQYVSAIEKGKDVTMPIGKREWFNDNSEIYLKEFCEQYGAEVDCMLYFFNNEWYASNDTLFLFVRIGGGFTLYLVLAFILLTVSKKMFGINDEEEQEKVDKEMLYGESAP